MDERQRWMATINQHVCLGTIETLGRVGAAGEGERERERGREEGGEEKQPEKLKKAHLKQSLPQRSSLGQLRSQRIVNETQVCRTR